MEDEATIWIIHWRIASNPELATGFFWFFNHFSMPRFKNGDVLQSLVDFVGQELKNRSESTLKSDVSKLLRMYSPTAGRNDEHLDSPMSLLGLLSNEVSGGYLSQRTVRPFLPVVALHFALQSRFAEPTAKDGGTTAWMPPLKGGLWTEVGQRRERLPSAAAGREPAPQNPSGNEPVLVLTQSQPFASACRRHLRYLPAR